MSDPGVRKLVLLAAIFFSGCGPKDAPGDEPGSTGASTDTTTGDSTSATPTTSGLPDTTTSTTATTSTMDTTGGPDDICGDFCGRVVECFPGQANAECPCANIDAIGPECVAAWQAARDCYAAESCEGIQQGTEPCWSIVQSALDQCAYGNDGCEVGDVVADDDSPGSCGIVVDCHETPDRFLVCDGESCTCTREEMTIGTCPADGVCEGNTNPFA
ncbi:MAG TPA: hypothetical protein VGB85_28410, partial [Nannocystis sp.]